MEDLKLSTIFSKKRAEALPDDLWGKYVLPLNYAQYNLFNFGNSTHIIGGRGSGKTMFLKYHCFPTMLSVNRENINDIDLEKIGIYWKPDTDFLKFINKDYLPIGWEGIFKTYVGLSLISELSKFVKTLINSNHKSDKLKELLKELIIPKEKAVFLNAVEDILLINLDEKCEFLRSELNDWLNYPLDKPPVVFAAKEKILYLIEYIFQKVPALEKSCFYVFIDEYENLLPKQQEIINSWMKHSSAPLIFSVAYKKHYQINANTTGPEKITRIHDYHIIDLEEDVYGEKNYSILAAEIILSNIQNYYLQKNPSFEKIIEFNLSSVSELKLRNNPLYKRKILKQIRDIFPLYSTLELAEEIFNDGALYGKLKELMNMRLKNTDFKVNDFINKDYLRESIINASLLHRKSKSFEAENLKKLFDNNSIKYKEWVNSTFVSTLLYLYSTYTDKVCPYYGGFNRFVLMSKNNVRHLLELCHKSLIHYEIENSIIPEIDLLYVPVEIQAKSARSVSREEFEHKLPDISSYGTKLQWLVERLGNLYFLSQKRKSQSEPEKNHFVVLGNNIEKHENKEIQKLLFESKIWTVLIAKKNTKSKDVLDNAFYEYHLHPIFAPYFQISPRQKRKFEFSISEFEIIFNGDNLSYKELYKEYAKKWESEETFIETKVSSKNQSTMYFG